jgi:hypothetical protein
MPRDQLKPRVPLLWGAAAWPPAARFTGVNRVRATVALPVLLAALALVLRLYGLSDKPLWYDEIVTLNRTNLPLAELVIDALKQKHYPTYFLLLGPFASADIDMARAVRRGDRVHDEAAANGSLNGTTPKSDSRIVHEESCGNCRCCRNSIAHRLERGDAIWSSTKCRSRAQSISP